jgi:Toprim domain
MHAFSQNGSQPRLNSKGASVTFEGPPPTAGLRPIEGLSMSIQASDVARRLAEQAEFVCRHYLSNGQRVGHYWIVGDARNAPGRSMFVRLRGPGAGKGAAGKWTDAATGEHGDLLDVIRESCGFTEFSDVLAEARRYLTLPPPELPPKCRGSLTPCPVGSPESARRLFAISKPIRGTIAETYLRKRGISVLHQTTSLRFHPRCYYKPDHDSPTETWPALIAAVTTLNGVITGVHRTWLDPSGRGKAPIDTPRRAMGYLPGNAVRFGFADDVIAAGEGIETILSLRCVLPALPMAAALSANHLSAMLLPAGLRRLYIARDADAAGDAVQVALAQRAASAGIEAITLSPRLSDFNEDLHVFGRDALRAALRIQLVPEDVDRFLLSSTGVDA